MRAVAQVASTAAILTALIFVPLAAAAPVEVRDTSNGADVRCSEIRTLGPAAATGGCLIDAFAGEVDMKVVTSLGQFDFGTCGASYTVRIGGRGRTLTEEVLVLGPSPCPDVEPCFPGDSNDDLDPYRWEGRIRAIGDRLEHRVEACLDTCMGRFEGELVTPLRERGGRWYAMAEEGAVGMSGWALGGARWEWEPGDENDDDDGGTGLSISPR